MTIATNTFTTYSEKGIREDLADIIYNISPTETPFVTGAGRGKIDNTFFEWQTDSLATAVTTNQQLEGDDITSYDAVTATVRLGNYAQISRKTVVTAGTTDAVNLAGRKSELAYQISKKSAELKRDVAANLMDNIAAVAGNTTTARVTGSLLAFIKTNYDKASGGVVPIYTTSPTDVWTNGTQRAFTETILKNVMSQCFTSGAQPTDLLVGPWVKQVASGFTGIAALRMNQQAVKAASVIGAADVYLSDFGILNIVPNRFQRGRDAFFLDYEYVSIDYLRPFNQSPLAKTGDAEKRLILAEYGLRVKSEKALGVAVDLSTS
jgi:hypothetical protein